VFTIFLVHSSIPPCANDNQELYGSAPLCSSEIVAADNPFAFMGAFVIISLAVCLAWWQYRSVVRRNVAATRRVAITFFVLAGFFSFALVSNVLEYMFKRPRSLNSFGLAVIVAILGCMAAYFVFSAVLNWKWYKALRSPEDAKETASDSVTTLAAPLSPLVGVDKGLPSDVVCSHDYDIHRQPKR